MSAVIELRHHPSLEPLRPGTGRVRFDDEAIGALLERHGLVGDHLVRRLVLAVKAKLLLRDGRDAVCISGPRGSGRHLLVDAMHAAAARFLGRTGGCERVLCGLVAREGGLLEAVERRLRAARGGTLVLDQLDTLAPVERQALIRLIGRYQSSRTHTAVLVLGVDMPPAEGVARPEWRGPRLELPACAARVEDLSQLVQHFVGEAVADCGAPPALAETLASERVVEATVTHARKSELTSIGTLREVVRDLVFDAWAEDGEVDALLALRGWVAPQRPPAPAVDQGLLGHLAELHGVPQETLRQQMQVVSDVMAHIGDVPPSYTNVMKRAEDIKRAGLWLLTAAESQAAFRRWFGDEDFMRPSKSGAWALYHQVFKLDT